MADDCVSVLTIATAHCWVLTCVANQAHHCCSARCPTVVVHGSRLCAENETLPSTQQSPSLACVQGLAAFRPPRNKRALTATISEAARLLATHDVDGDAQLDRSEFGAFIWRSALDAGFERPTDILNHLITVAATHVRGAGAVVL